MMLVLQLICVFLIFHGSWVAESKATPKFGSVYVVQGTLYIPYAEIREPFTGWFDLAHGRSRIDYYGGMVKTYQLAKSGNYGLSLKVAPVTTEEVKNEAECLQVVGSKDAPVVPQAIVPDLAQFDYVGQDMLNGLTCDKWRLLDVQGDKVNKYTMWTRQKGNASVPVRYEMRGYNTLLGSHYDHYYLDYEWFSTDVPDDEVFTVQKNLTCHGFPGPGWQHLATFNPMREFVNHENDHVHLHFTDFIRKFDRKYLGSVKEYLQRSHHFLHNLRFINSHNRKGLSFKMEVNHLADYSIDELAALRGRKFSMAENNGGLKFPHDQNDIEKISKDLPDHLDWRINGAVTPVKDQSVCGSCWSFGTVGTIEGAYFLKYKKLVAFSQQALIDCSWGYGNNGCDGGEDFRSYQWAMKHGGIPSEDAYGPYLGQDGYCHADEALKEQDKAVIASYVNVTSGSEDALRVALSLYGPISVAIDASHRTFAFYANGVYFEPKCGNGIDQLDHAVLAVGYGVLNGERYWLIKNSWSNYWGNMGFVLMSTKDNNCGVTTTPTYVNIA